MPKGCVVISLSGPVKFKAQQIVIISVGNTLSPMSSEENTGLLECVHAFLNQYHVSSTSYDSLSFDGKHVKRKFRC